MTEPEITRPSLADAFKGSGSGRAASLGGLLPKPAREAGPAPKSAPAPVAPTRALQRTPAPPTTQRRRAATQPVGVQNVAVYLDPDTLALVRAAKSRTAAGEPEKTYDEILVDALDHIDLEQLREQFASTQPETTGGPLQRRARRPRGSGGIQIQLRLDGNQRQALDELTDNTGAPSRSALVATAYRLHLTTGKS